MANIPQNANGQATMANSQPTVIASNQSTLPITATDTTSAGTLGALNQTVVLSVSGQSSASIKVTGTWVGTITFEGSVDGTTWDSINAVAATTSQPQPTTTVNGLYRLTPGALLQIRANMTLYTSGTTTISMRASLASAGTFFNQIAPTKITDGTNTATIKPASTASTATDLPLVVALHPTSPLPIGTNLLGKVGIDQTTDGVTNKIALGQVVFQYSANETGNSTVVQLSTGATYTGVIEAIPNQPAFSVLLFSDQNATLTIRQFIDATGTQKVYEKIYTYVANSQLAVSAAANGNYFQAIVQNNGGVTTTKLNLNTAYGVVDSATPLNNKPHALYEIAGTAVDTNTGNASAGTQRMVLANNQPAIPVTQQTITKGTQGTTGVTTQDLKDAGRSARTITLDSFNVATIAETLMTMSYSSDNGTLTTGTSYTVTAGKRFRIQSIIASSHTIAGNTTIAGVIVRVRANNVGVALISSPVQFIQPVYGTASVNQSAIHSAIAIPDGWEFVGGAGIGITVACAGFVATTAAPKVDITIIGYEY